ncbi:PTS system, N-acetylglucosamine-specific IIA component / PTS system, N-acetylglucosamine-specific IIB component / PTS system, N-acetylglucosamine-specific IIC component [hydrothermal vent metagenome]|uniref:PTS system, N-acetylglucosamine-specific IIA component / PTS system, N-acetylglucosamine-specific IIB component / PTS system, N-acetylglucosamine-specific IIC component n=1 Tax=hydrothermal vent metagenome TaxID=652676 RepID=A0A1W1CSU3_9ZZZZ
MFNFLQQIGKALMTPIAVLPVAAILLRLGFGDIFDGQIALIMKSAGEAIFSNLDLLFGIGIAYGLAKNNDGAAALAGAIGVLIAKAVYLSIDTEVNMGVFVGIIIGVLAGTIYNRFHTIQLPEYLGFFSGKRFVPILTAIMAIFVGVLAGYFWQYAQAGIDVFSHLIIGLEEVGTFIYGVLNRLLIPLGLHHILNSIFWFQLGEYSYLKDGVEVVANGDLHRFFAGDKSAGFYMSGFYVVMMFGLPSMALAIYLTTPKSQRKKAGAILFGVAFTSFLTGITEPLEFLFLFIAPILFVIHALLTGLALALAQILDIHAGFGFSAGLIDYLINYKLATNPLLILPLGLAFTLLYFITSYYAIKIFKLKIFEEENTKEKKLTPNAEALAFIDALGGKENILNTDACITRLRMSVKDNSQLKDSDFIALGAKGVIRPDKKSVQIVLGTRAESVAEEIKESVKHSYFS